MVGRGSFGEKNSYSGFGTWFHSTFSSRLDLTIITYLVRYFHEYAGQ